MLYVFTLVLAMDGLIDVLEIGEQGVTTCHALVIVIMKTRMDLCVLWLEERKVSE